MVKTIAFVSLCASVLLFLWGWGTIIYGLILWSWPLTLEVGLIGSLMLLLSWMMFMVSDILGGP